MSKLYSIGSFSYVDVERNLVVRNIAPLSSLLSSTRIKEQPRGGGEIVRPKGKYRINIKRIREIVPLKLTAPHKNLSLSDFFSNKKAEIVDLRDRFPPVFSQGELGSCTAQALCAVIGYDVPGFIGSRLFLYYNERFLENSLSDDAGAELKDGVETLKIYGICPETDWPYDISKFTTRPPDEAYEHALENKAIEVKHIDNTKDEMIDALDHGYPFVVGIMVYESFESYEVLKSGMVPMPYSYETSLGGHAVVCVGYNDIKKVWIMRNSWGAAWGDSGYFYLPYEYLLRDDLASDLWCVMKIS